MGGFEVAAIMLLIGFLGGVLTGVVAIVSVASRREDRYHSLTGDAPDAACRGVRRLTGMRVQGSGFPRIAPAQAGEEAGEDRADAPRWPQ